MNYFSIHSPLRHSYILLHASSIALSCLRPLIPCMVLCKREGQLSIGNFGSDWPVGMQDIP